MKRFFRALIALCYLLAATPAPAGFLINSYSVAPAAGGSLCSFIGAVTDATNLTTYSFVGASIGTAAADRFVVVGVMGRGNAGGARTISSSTIGGVSATTLKTDSDANPSGWVGLTVTTGTTATIAVTMSGAMNQMTIAVYTCTGLASTTPESTLFNSAADPTGTIAVSAGSWTLACAMQDASTTNTWTGPTEDYDATNESSTMSAAHISQGSANASFTVTATFASGSAGSMSVLSML